MISACEAADQSMQQTRLNESLSVPHEGAAPSHMRSMEPSVSGGRHLHASPVVHILFQLSTTEVESGGW